MADLGDLDGVRSKEVWINDMMLTIYKGFYHKTYPTMVDGEIKQIADTDHPFPCFHISMFKNYMEGVENADDFLDQLVGDLRSVANELEVYRESRRTRSASQEKPKTKILERDD